jgi:DNA-binding XRE family transcriptional regulator
MSTIRALRQEQGWTQFELAMRVGVQSQAVYLWESGRRLPQVPQLRMLGQLFGICSDDILLEPVNGPAALAAPRARVDRSPGEQSPGRDDL